MDPLTMSLATVTFSGTPLQNIPVNIQTIINGAHFTRFPAIWTPFSPDPGIRVQVTNHSVSAPIAPMLVDAYGDPGTSGSPIEYSIFAELTTVQPGQVVDEIVAGIPVTQMYLLLWHLGVSTAELAGGFNVDIAAWRL